MNLGPKFTWTDVAMIVVILATVIFAMYKDRVPTVNIKHGDTEISTTLEKAK